MPISADGYSSRGDAPLPQPRYVHEWGAASPPRAERGEDTEPGIVVAVPEQVLAQGRAGQRCKRIPMQPWRHRAGSEDGLGRSIEFRLAPSIPLLPPASPGLPNYYLVGAVATKPHACHTLHRVGERARGPRPAGLETPLRERCCVVSSHAEPARLRDAGFFFVCAQVAAAQQPCDTGGLTVTADTFHACLTRAWG